MTIFNKLIAIVISAIIIIIALIIFAYDLTTISVNDTPETNSSKLLNDDVEILVNTYGIKKIKASSEYDLFFGQGYAHAQDRLWQMDILRRQPEGRLSELFGKESLPIDKFMKALNFEQIAKKMYDSLSEKSKFILQAYSDGINHFIKTNSNKLSFEFAALDYIPENWEPYHSLMIARYLALEMSFSFWNDITFGEIAEIYGQDIALDLISGYNQNTPRINKINSNDFDYQKKEFLESIENDSLLSHFSKTLDQVSNFLGNSGGTKGSNGWAVQKNRNNNKDGAILSNDPHLRLSLPSIWYQNHLLSEDIDVLGYSFPGIPLIIVGRNKAISWGITNLMADICDFYFEKTDSTKDNYFINDTEVKPFIFKIDTIKVRNENDYIYYKRSTDRSPVISDAHIFKENDYLIKYDSKDVPKFFDDYVLTYNWTAKETTDEILAMYKMNKAVNFNEFKSGYQNWGVPPLVFQYADTAGNIAVSPTGVIPDRKSECNPNLPNPAWIDNYGWSGVYKPNIFNELYNPDEAFVFSANNPYKSDNGVFLSNYWEPESRAIRINEMILESEEFSVRDSRYMQNDILSPYARSIISYILPILQKQNDFNALESQCINALEEWDYLMSASSYEASIYNVLLTQIVQNTFKDELGERLFNQYCFLSSLPTRKILFDVQNQNNFWFDDKNTDKIESFDDMLIKSFRSSIEYLRIHFQSDNISDWKYGEIHRLHLKHLFSKNKYLKPVVNVDALEVGGNNTTINNTEYQYSNPYNMLVGASLRFIADMENDYVLMSLPGGNSGDPMSPQYADQIRLWLNGGYATVSFNKETDYSIITTIESRN